MLPPSKSLQTGSVGRNRSLDKIYKCDVCEERFVMSSDYVVHMRVHTNEKPYECEICGKAFAKKGNLNAHKNIHLKENLFLCNVCLKGFSRSTRLKAHQTTHCTELSRDEGTQSRPRNRMETVVEHFGPSGPRNDTIQRSPLSKG